MQSKRFQYGSISPRQRGSETYWFGQWREDGQKRTRELGLVSVASKSEAKRQLAAILRPFNEGVARPEPSFDEYVEQVYLPWFERKNKVSTVVTTMQLIRQHLLGKFGAVKLRAITREQLQAVLDQQAPLNAASVVSHMRWQLSAIWTLAKSEGVATLDAADALYVPANCKAGRPRLTLALADIPRLFAAFDLRERLIFRLGIISGLRPGEIFALSWPNVGEASVGILERVYMGKMGTPKNGKVRVAALSNQTREDLKLWRELALDPDGWVFPSEAGTPLGRNNFLRVIQPTLDEIGLGWVTFQVMRRTNASLSRKAGIDDKISADQRGHTLGVSLEVYAQSDIAEKISAVNTLEASWAPKKKPASAAAAKAAKKGAA